MNSKTIRYLIIAILYLAVLYPLWVRISGVSWALDSTLLSNLFPLFGIIAFVIMWLHVVGSAFDVLLKKYIDFKKFVENTTIIVLISIILHPLLLLILVGFNFSDIFYYGEAKYIWLAIVGWILLISYDIGRALKKFDFIFKNWKKIEFFSTIGFLLTFFHSIGLGSDLQSGPLRILWIFYGVTAIIATIYNYGVKRFLK